MHDTWRDLDQAALDRNYNARESVPDYAAEAARYAKLSAQARATHAYDTHVWDPNSGLKLDWFRGAPGRPVFLWIHGGYWRALGRADQSCVAPGLVAAGIHVAIMDYTLVPGTDLDGIVAETRACAAWCATHAAAIGAGPLYVGGSSAGGHLAGMLLAAAPAPIAGAIALSGLYDLEPVRHSFVNDWMRLDAAAVARLSPIRHIPAGPAPRLLASYGSLETAEFRRQTEAYAAAWQAAGHNAALYPAEGRHHFDIVTALGYVHDPLCRRAVEFIR